MTWVPVVLSCSLWHPPFYRGIIKAQRCQIIISLLWRYDFVLNTMEMETETQRNWARSGRPGAFLAHSHSKRENHQAGPQLHIRPWLCPRPWLLSKYMGHIKDQEPRVVVSVELSQLSVRLTCLRFRKPLDSTCDNYRIPTYIDEQQLHK